MNKGQTDYIKYDNIIKSLRLSELKLVILNRHINGMMESKSCAELGIGRDRINSRKPSIHKIYYARLGKI